MFLFEDYCMKKISILMLSLFISILSCFCKQTAELGNYKEKWTIATQDTRLTVGATDKGQLFIYELSAPLAGWNWVNSSPVPLMDKVIVNGKKQNVQWQYQDGVFDNTDGQKITIRFVCDQPAMELKSVWQAKPGPGPVRHTMFITNKTNGQITISEQETFDLQVTGLKNKNRVFYISDDAFEPDRYGVYRDSLVNGYQKTLIINQEQDFIPFLVVDAGQGNGMYMGWEWSIGRVSMADSYNSSGVHLKVGNRDDFRTDLSAGETFEVPPGFIGAYKGDLDDMGNSLRKYLFNYSIPAIIRNDSSYPKVEWNAFAATGKEPGGWDPSEKNYFKFIDDIAPLGFDEVVLDINWWSSYNDPNHILMDPVDWPSGMEVVEKYAHNRGLRFGLYDNESKNLTCDSGRKERFDDLTYLIKNFKADFYRSDATAGYVIKGAYSPGHKAHYPEDKDYWSVKAFYEVTDSLYATIPTFTWENCACGGTIKDFGTLKRASKIQNTDRYYPMNARQSFYDASFAIHPIQIASMVGSWVSWTAEGSVYEFRSASMGASMWGPDGPSGGNGGEFWSKQQRSDITKAVATYKNKLRPLIRNGNLYHIFPRPDEVVWDGIEYYDPEVGKGVVYIFKPSDGIDSTNIKPRGLDAKATYHITFEDGSNPDISMTGEQLMAGITVILKGSPVSELLFFECDKSSAKSTLKKGGKLK
jgi:hypothetical protein